MSFPICAEQMGASLHSSKSVGFISKNAGYHDYSMWQCNEFYRKGDTGGKKSLYGRATGIYKMTEMPFSDVIKFFPDYPPEDQITVYAILGGIPHYLKTI